MELGRVPFDFFEGESELISGYNLEFRSIFFIYLFIIEYLDIIYYSLISLIIFFNINFILIIYYYIIIIFILLILLIRGFILRYRYDKIMIII